MKSILIPIKPYWAYSIMKNFKKIELRKFYITDPNWNRKIKCYVSKDKQSFRRIPEADQAEFIKYIGRVALEFVSQEISTIQVDSQAYKYFLPLCCLTMDEIIEYSNGNDLYGYLITDLKIYDKPKELGEFRHIQPKDCCGANYGEYCEGERTDEYCKYVKDYKCNNRITKAPQNYIFIDEV